MAAYATLAELTARFPRTLTTEEQNRALVLLDDATFWLGAWVPGLDAAILAGVPLVAMAAKLLVIAMVRRTLLSPGQGDGVQDETIGPFRVVYRNPEGNLYLYGSELEDITNLLRPKRASAVSMRSPGL